MDILSTLWNIKYCENISHSIISEPLNTISNISYIIIAIFLRHTLKKSNHLINKIKGLLLIIASIWIGSWIRHSHISHSSIYFDVLPIMIFTIYSIYLLFSYLFNSQKKTIIFLLLSGIFIITTSYLLRTYYYSELFNGAYEYFAVGIVILTVIITKYKKFLPYIKELSYITILFIIATTCRQIDLIICDKFILWTHFLRHIVNAICAYFLTQLFAKKLVVQ